MSAEEINIIQQEADMIREQRQWEEEENKHQEEKRKKHIQVEENEKENEVNNVNGERLDFPKTKESPVLARRGRALTSLYLPNSTPTSSVPRIGSSSMLCSIPAGFGTLTRYQKLSQSSRVLRSPQTRRYLPVASYRSDFTPLPRDFYNVFHPGLRSRSLNWSRGTMRQALSPEKAPDPVAEDMFLRKIRQAQSRDQRAATLPLARKALSVPSLPTPVAPPPSPAKRFNYRHFAALPFEKPILTYDEDSFHIPDTVEEEKDRDLKFNYQDLAAIPRKKPIEDIISPAPKHVANVNNNANDRRPVPSTRTFNTPPPLSAPPVAMRSGKQPPPIPEKTMSFKDRRLLFEHQNKKPEVDPNVRRKKISLVSDQDLGTLKREEQRKFGTLSKEDIRKSMDLNVEGLDEVVHTMEEMAEPIQVAHHEQPVSPSYKVHEKPHLTAQERLMGRSAAKSLSDGEAIRTLERDMDITNKFFNDSSPFSPPATDPLRDLSPAERRTQDAMRRQQWRQERFKSLEDDAIQAQMVITRERLLQRGKLERLSDRSPHH